MHIKTNETVQYKYMKASAQGINSSISYPIFLGLIGQPVHRYKAYVKVIFQ